MTKPNVLLVILDSVRARNTSLYDYERETTPFLEGFADDATMYSQARAPGIHTVASHASMFTGHHVAEHRMIDHGAELDPEATIWHELSAEHDYRTALFSPNPILTVSSNLAEPFTNLDGPRRDARDRYFKHALAPTDMPGHHSKREYLQACLNSGKPLKSVVNGLFFQYSDRGGYDPAEEGADEYVASFLDWSADVDGPWAGCLNLMDAHYPYDPRREFDLWADEESRAIHDGLSNPASRQIATTEEWFRLGAIEPLYDGCIRQADAALKTLVSGLRDRGDLDDTLVVITSDHGEGFGEHSRVNPAVRMADHSWGIHEVLTHVPLIVRWPAQRSAGVKDELSSLTEFPSVVSDTLQGEDASFTVEEYALASTYRLKDPDAVLPTDCDNRDEYRGPWRAVFEKSSGAIRKHVTRQDQHVTVHIENAANSYEVNNGEEELVEEIYGSLTDASADLGGGRVRDIDEDVERQLEELGYLR